MSGTPDISDLLEKLGLTPEKSDRHNDKVEWGPIEHIAHYSDDSQGNIRYDSSCLRAFTNPHVPANLRDGAQKFFMQNEHNRMLGHPVPLDTLVAACAAFGQEHKLRKADVVTSRGLLVRLMLGQRVDVQFSCVDGVLHLGKYDPTPYRSYAFQLREGYHGYAFEGLCTGSEPDLSLWKCIVSRSLGDLNIVFGGEVDCVKGSYDGTSKNFVELKTTCIHGQRKRKQWYLQSFLLGVPEVCVGYTDSERILQRVEVEPLGSVYVTQDRDVVLERSCRSVYLVLKELKAFCAAQALSGAGTTGQAWLAAVHQGTLLGSPYQLAVHLQE